MDKTKTNHKVCSDISIALCTCEGSFFLPEQLESLMEQSLLPGELVVSDDASTDGTVQLLEAFTEKAPFEVKLVQNETRLGAVQNFNQALGLCRGRYVALCDQDDTWLPGRLESSLQAMEEAEKQWGSKMPLLVHSDLKVVDAGGEVVNSSFMKMRKIRHIERQPLSKLLAQNFVTGNTVLINRPLLEAALPVAGDAIMHDWWLALVAAALGKIVFIEEPTVLYRQHSQNVIGANDFFSPGNLKRAIFYKNMEEEIAAIIKQTEALQGHLVRFGELKHLGWLEEYLHSLTNGGLPAAITARRFGVLKQGAARNIIYLLLLLKGGYTDLL